MTKDALMKKIRMRIKQCESQTRAADSMDVSAQYLNDVLSGRRDPGAKILIALGVERVVTYRTVAK